MATRSWTKILRNVFTARRTRVAAESEPLAKETAKPFDKYSGDTPFLKLQDAPDVVASEDRLTAELFDKVMEPTDPTLQAKETDEPFQKADGLEAVASDERLTEDLFSKGGEHEPTLQAKETDEPFQKADGLEAVASDERLTEDLFSKGEGPAEESDEPFLKFTPSPEAAPPSTTAATADTTKEVQSAEAVGLAGDAIVAEDAVTKAGDLEQGDAIAGRLEQLGMPEDLTAKMDDLSETIGPPTDLGSGGDLTPENPISLETAREPFHPKGDLDEEASGFGDPRLMADGDDTPDPPEEPAPEEPAPEEPAPEEPAPAEESPVDDDSGDPDYTPGGTSAKTIIGQIWDAITPDSDFVETPQTAMAGVRGTPVPDEVPPAALTEEEIAAAREDFEATKPVDPGGEEFGTSTVDQERVSEELAGIDPQDPYTDPHPDEEEEGTLGLVGGGTPLEVDVVDTLIDPPETLDGFGGGLPGEDEGPPDTNGGDDGLDEAP